MLLALLALPMLIGAVYALDLGDSSDDTETDDDPIEDMPEQPTPETTIEMAPTDNAYEGTDESEEILGTMGGEEIVTNGGDDLVQGYGGNDAISLGSGNDWAHAGSGDDYVEGNGGDDVIYGGKGDDTVEGGYGNDYLFLGGGNDYSGISSGDDEITGSGYMETGDDYIDGGAGDDLMIDEIGANILHGGDGDDRIFGEDVKGTEAPDMLFGDDGDDYIVGDDGDTMTGGAGADTFGLFQSGDTDSVFITDFNTDEDDLIIKWLDRDLSHLTSGELHTPENDSTLTYRDTDAGLAIDIDGTEVAVLAGLTEDDFPNITIYASGVAGYYDAIYDHAVTEGEVFNGTDAREYIIGTSSDDTIFAGGGDDTITSGGGDDTLVGNGGNDFIYAGTGNDIAEGGWGDDRIELGGGDDTYGFGLTAGNLEDNAQIYLQGGNDTVLGQEGNDTIIDISGANVLSGGEGDDILYGYDVVDELATSGNLPPETGDTSDHLIGGAGNDVIFADNGDQVTGGTGADSIAAAFQRDIAETAITVTDFDLSEDKLIVDVYGNNLQELTNEELSFSDTPEGLAVTYLGETVAVLNGITAANLPADPSSIFEILL
ncbi:calcium-binding protein [Celeribacter baekdonensis]|uniref:Hemolysin-type calcium-binding repeat family protein n=1 Tax=Celeribacter baekdonensis B30 TaxID=1208323 RepID=K2JJQ0_9RHOB|nr:calcium-binding protein [Celeribacter baekdonensis]EKE70759.1 hemolysin-type calcium-binding repeat family protein [Celeribacter baekdonensis B30]